MAQGRQIEGFEFSNLHELIRGGKMKTCVYGAGNYTQRYLNVLKKEYEVEYILDESVGKQGTYCCGIPIVKPDEINVNLYPVIISIRNVVSGYNSLMKLNCKQDIYVLISAGKACYLYLFDVRANVNELFASIKRIGEDFKIKKTVVSKVPGKRRCFDMTWMSSGLVNAGPAACVHKLCTLNDEFGLIDNLYTLWPDVAYVPKDEMCDISVAYDDNWGNGYSNGDKVLSSLEKYPIMYATRYIELNLIKNYWLQMEKIFRFNTSDIFLIQDNVSAYAFRSLFPNLKNIIVVYHAQGSLRYETMKSDPYAGEMYDAMQADLLKYCRKWVFPSSGAADALYETGSKRMKTLHESCEIKVVHSGYQSKYKLEPSSRLISQLNALDEVDMTFVTATKLYYSKGVEYIPLMLANLKKQIGIKIRWFLIGSGQMEHAVEENIKKYLLPDDYIWYKERFPNQDDLFHIFTLADFYILMHRVSIFDLSILQAMSYGCIPFLSKIGGNLEFCAYDNGILVSHDCVKLDIDKIKVNGEISKVAINELKEKNVKVVRQHFGYKNFLMGFKDVIESC